MPKVLKLNSQQVHMGGVCPSYFALLCICITRTLFFFFSLFLRLSLSHYFQLVLMLCYLLCYEGLAHFFELVLIAYSLCLSAFPPPALALPAQQEGDYECLVCFVPSPDLCLLSKG